jgi:hypothetical protein
MDMTPARRVTLAVSVPVAAALIGWGAFSAVAAVGTGQYTFSTPLSASGKTVTANLEDGDVTVVTGAAARLSGTVKYSLIRPAIRVTGTGVSYHCEVPTGDCGMTATLTVPTSVTSVNLSSSGGDLTVNRGITGNASLSTDGGDLTVNGGITGNASLSSGGGDVDATGLAGMTTLESDGGDVTASGITASEVTASSSGGDITLTFTKIPVRVQVNSDGGDITIVVPRGSYQIDATADGGTVSAPASDPGATDTVTASSVGGDVTISES